MKGDFTRFTFDRKKHYSGIRMQQGRVQLDSDWNELGDIQAYRMRTESEDFIGPSGTPKLAAGFAIQAVSDGTDLTISPGRMYVDGILCENEEEILLTAQPDLPGFTLPQEDGLYLAYLEVWHRHVTALEDPSLREVGLGGPDTATRVKTVWQVNLHRVGDVGMSADATTDFPGWTSEIAPSTGALRARVQPGAASQLRNRLYRVEIHRVDPATGKVGLKWSRDNGSIAVRWLDQSGVELIVESPGGARALDISPGDWIELADDTCELWVRPGRLVRVIGIVEDRLTIDPATAAGSIELAEFPLSAKVRRWDSHGEIEIDPEGARWIALEHGVEVKIRPGKLRPGDYWLIPARGTAGGIEWPRGSDREPEAVLPRGIGRHNSRLALAELEAGTFKLREDCRFVFSSLTDLKEMKVLQAATNAPAGAIYVDAAGKVGVGTAAPAHQLDVVGTIRTDADAQVAGNATVGGNLRVEQAFSANGDTHFARNVTVAGDAHMARNASVGGNLQVAQHLRGYGDAHFARNVTVVGDLSARRVLSRHVLSEVVAGNFVRISSLTDSPHWVDMPNMGMTIYTGGRPMLILFTTGGVQATGIHGLVHAEFRLLVDGAAHAYCMHEFHQWGGALRDVSLVRLLWLGTGAHRIWVQWSVRSPGARGGYWDDPFWFQALDPSGIPIEIREIFSSWIPEMPVHLSASWYGSTRSLVAIEL